jgi:ribosomal protein S18 acetylase RimI-like enzyme
MRRDLRTAIVSAPLPAGMALAPFTPEIAPACRDLMNRVYDGTFGDSMTFDAWWPWVIGDTEYDPSMMFVAVSTDGVVGFCHGWREPFIKDLVVASEWRRQGLATALLTRALTEYTGRGHTFVDLKTDTDNLRAQALYRKLGFDVVERVG